MALGCKEHRIAASVSRQIGFAELWKYDIIML